MSSATAVPDAPWSLPSWGGQPWAHHLTPAARVVAVSGGLMLAGMYWRLGPESGLLSAAWCVLLAVLPALAAVDLAVRILPSRVIFAAGSVVVLLLAAATAVGDLGPSTLARAVIVAFVTVLAGVGLVLVAPRGGFGLGDVRFCGLLGLLLGLHSWLLPLVALLVVAPLLALVPALLAAARTKVTAASIPFGPYLALAAVLGAFAPTALVHLTV